MNTPVAQSGAAVTATSLLNLAPDTLGIGSLVPDQQAKQPKAEHPDFAALLADLSEPQIKAASNIQHSPAESATQIDGPEDIQVGSDPLEDEHVTPKTDADIGLLSPNKGAEIITHDTSGGSLDDLIRLETSSSNEFEILVDNANNKLVAEVSAQFPKIVQSEQLFSLQIKTAQQTRLPPQVVDAIESNTADKIEPAHAPALMSSRSLSDDIPTTRLPNDGLVSRQPTEAVERGTSMLFKKEAPASTKLVSEINGRLPPVSATEVSQIKVTETVGTSILTKPRAVFESQVRGVEPLTSTATRTHPVQPVALPEQSIDLPSATHTHTISEQPFNIASSNADQSTQQPLRINVPLVRKSSPEITPKSADVGVAVRAQNFSKADRTIHVNAQVPVKPVKFAATEQQPISSISALVTKSVSPVEGSSQSTSPPALATGLSAQETRYPFPMRFVETAKQVGISMHSAETSSADNSSIGIPSTGNPATGSPATGSAYFRAPTTPSVVTARVNKTPAINTSNTTISAPPNSDASAAKETDSTLFSLVTSDAHEVFNWDSSRSVATPSNAVQPLRSDLAPHVARQLAEVMTQAAHRPVEIALSPEELGRVRMTVVSDDTTITVNIIAERSDTLDLMRRHIDQLGQTFRSLGYDQINFEFGQGHEGQEQTSEGTQDTQSDAESHANLGETQQPIEETTNIHINSAPGNGVDIRL